MPANASLIVRNSSCSLRPSEAARNQPCACRCQVMVAQLGHCESRASILFLALGIAALGGSLNYSFRALAGLVNGIEPERADLYAPRCPAHSDLGDKHFPAR